MTDFVTIPAHVRQKPYAKERAETTAKLLAEVETKIDRAISASLRTFPINVWRDEKAGRL